MLNLVFALVPSALTLIVILLAPSPLLPAYEVIYETERRNILATRAFKEGAVCVIAPRHTATNWSVSGSKECNFLEFSKLA